MPMPEQEGGEPPREQARYPVYWRAACYPDEQSAGEVYFRAQQALFSTQFDLSVYRFQLDRVWHVAMLGDPPSAEFDQTVQAILADGEPTMVPAPILTALNERRLRARQLGPWVERHYRPGKPGSP